VAKFNTGDLVKLRDKIHASGCSVGVVTEVRQIEYVKTDASMTVVKAVFGVDELTLSENDFILLRRLNDE
tara:strand:- start:338 stop:547 length:210 start_codon:yes stop_codon:yes gene_type:complete